MRIVHLIDGMPPAAAGGAGRIALELARACVLRGHTAVMVTAARPGDMPASVDGIPCIVVEQASSRFAHYTSVFGVRRAKRIAALILAQKPDVVHAHVVAWHLGYAWMPIVARAGVPVVWTAHDAMSVAYGKIRADEAHPVLRDIRRVGIAWNPLRNVCIRRALRTCAMRIAVSDALGAYLRSRGIPIDRVLHNGIDAAFWMPGVRAEARRALGIPEHACVFLLAGRLGYDKGVAAALAALPTDAVLLLAGEAYGQGKDDVRVRALGPLGPEAMRQAYAACDAALVPSVYLDPFPTVCLEAMACGRPVIATSHGGAQEAVRHGEDGWIVDPLDLDALRERLAWCASHPDELARCGASGRARACMSFPLDAFAAAMLEIYASLARG